MVKARSERKGSPGANKACPKKIPTIPLDFLPNNAAVVSTLQGDLPVAREVHAESTSCCRKFTFWTDDIGPIGSSCLRRTVCNCTRYLHPGTTLLRIYFFRLIVPL